MIRVKTIKGSHITYIYDDGFGSYKVDLKNGETCKMHRDELIKALKTCTFKGTMAKKYRHLELK